MSNVWAHDLVERLKIRRKVMAKDCGLGDVEVGTYPSYPATIINDNGGFWKGLALAGLTSAGLGAGFLALTGAPDIMRNKKTPLPSPTLYEIEIIGTDSGVEVKSVRPVNETK